jgi:hypothetical protein
VVQKDEDIQLTVAKIAMNRGNMKVICASNSSRRCSNCCSSNNVGRMQGLVRIVWMSVLLAVGVLCMMSVHCDAYRFGGVATGMLKSVGVNRMNSMKGHRVSRQIKIS